MTAAESRAERRRAIFAAGSLDALLDQPGGRAVLEAEAADTANPEQLLDRDQLDHLLAVRRPPGARFGLLSTDDVFLVPGFMGSTLRDVGAKDRLIWIDPLLWRGERGERLGDLPLDAYDPDRPDRDGLPGVRIESRGAIPAVYDLLALDLEFRRYDVQTVPVDWRKDLERSAALLADRIRGRLGQRPRPLHLVAHSQGSLVARRAVHLLGPDQARRLVNTLVLLAPASFGTFSAAFAVAGNHPLIASLNDLWVKVPGNLQTVLKTFTGLYQLLPWKPGTVADSFDVATLGQKEFWRGLADADRLKYGFGWGAKIDTEFFNDRTAIILGDRPTVGAVEFDSTNKLNASGEVPGDGTVPDRCAMLPGVRTYRAAGAEHMTVPLSRAALGAVAALLRGDAPRVRSDGRLAAAELASDQKRENVLLKKLGLTPPPALTEPPKPGPVAASGGGRASAADPVPPDGAAPPAPVAAATAARPDLPSPPCRRLRVFSFDPLLATQLANLDIAVITIPVRWEPGEKLGAGPVGEYVEVVDRDPASGCFYHPVDLGDPRLAAQDGLPPAESDPRFHQQMVYAVAMATIDTFEKALGRAALWAPRPEREDGDHPPLTDEERYVPRLRVYPHALREANAYYDPTRHALLFGYFPSREAAGGATLPRGTVFACLSFDIIAHETTHALLHGLHRHFLEASNPDVFAFHEAFADAVAVFQHFSHPEVVRHQVAGTRGDLGKGELLGALAVQFGNALGGHRGAMRRYIGATPDPTKLRTTAEPHDRGAVLMAALFRAFVSIYEDRTRDLYRIATNGTGRLPDGDIHPDLVNRLAGEAAKSARHVLGMCVRALDYLPPVDPTFGDYLRALVTADFDLVQNDDRGYRVAVIDAFRQWGIYPDGVNVLDETALRWRAATGVTAGGGGAGSAAGRPAKGRVSTGSLDTLRAIVGRMSFANWTLRQDRKAAFLEMRANAASARTWLYSNARDLGDEGESLGLVVFSKGTQSIPRNEYNAPELEVHSARPCRRIGPDGQQRVDLVMEVVQRRAGYFDPDYQKQVDEFEGYWAFDPADGPRYAAEAKGFAKQTREGRARATAARGVGDTEAAEAETREADRMGRKAKRYKGLAARPVARRPDFWVYGGCTLLIDPETGQVRYCIAKSVRSGDRLAAQRAFARTGALPSLAVTYFGSDGQVPFAALHHAD